MALGRSRRATWRVVNNERRINNRPFYYTQVRVDPVDPNRVYTLAGRFNMSTDGGAHLRAERRPDVRRSSRALDRSARIPNVCSRGTDGGFFISNDYGRNWDFVNNMPMAQAYHLGVDMAEPYNVIGGFQDHEIWRGPNEKWNQVGVREGRLAAVALHGRRHVHDRRSARSEHRLLQRALRRHHTTRHAKPRGALHPAVSARTERRRRRCTTSIASTGTRRSSCRRPTPTSSTTAGNVLFKTTDRGETWSIISPDLTTNDKSKQAGERRTDLERQHARRVPLHDHLASRRARAMPS